jgi:CDP-diacylglycerol---serine O-phosphatidyltransferase
MNIFKTLRLPDYFSLLNLASGMMSIYSSINKNFFFSAIFLIFAVLFDFLDGKVARLTKKSSKLGFDIDSLADMVSFGVSPAVMIMSIFSSWISLTAGIFLTICGLLRLARFNISKKNNGYEGMPITFNGILFPLLYFLAHYNLIVLNLYIFSIIAILSGFLMVSNIKVKKII